jgi:hypothetical protein
LHRRRSRAAAFGSGFRPYARLSRLAHSLAILVYWDLIPAPRAQSIRSSISIMVGGSVKGLSRRAP